MKTVVFFGSIGIAKKILEEIILKQDVRLLGVCCEENINSWRKEESVYEFCKKKGIVFLDKAEIIEAKPDLGISVRYNKIITRDVIESFRLGIVNTHGGILPEYRGSYCNINAIINNEEWYGVTLHYIDEGIDCGDIIDIRKTRIQKEYTGLDLYKISEQFCYELIDENIGKILDGTNQRISQNEYIKKGHSCHEYKAKETLKRKFIENIADKQAYQIIKAFDSNVHEPAYTMAGGEKIYLRTRY